MYIKILSILKNKSCFKGYAPYPEILAKISPISACHQYSKLPQPLLQIMYNTQHKLNRKCGWVYHENNSANHILLITMKPKSIPKFCWIYKKVTELQYKKVNIGSQIDIKVPTKFSSTSSQQNILPLHCTVEFM